MNWKIIILLASSITTLCISAAAPGFETVSVDDTFALQQLLPDGSIVDGYRYKITSVSPHITYTVIGSTDGTMIKGSQATNTIGTYTTTHSAFQECPKIRKHSKTGQ